MLPVSTYLCPQSQLTYAPQSQLTYAPRFSLNEPNGLEQLAPAGDEGHHQRADCASLRHREQQVPVHALANVKGLRKTDGRTLGCSVTFAAHRAYTVTR